MVSLLDGLIFDELCGSRILSSILLIIVNTMHIASIILNQYCSQ